MDKLRLQFMYLFNELQVLVLTIDTIYMLPLTTQLT